MKQLKWIVQNNIFKETEYDAFCDTIRKLDFPLETIKVVPFSFSLGLPDDEQTIPPINPEGPVVVYGSTTLCRIAKKRNWFPGAFFNPETFRHEAWEKNWGTEMLNYGAEIMRFADASFEGRKFIRPVDDLKAFSGEVIDGERFYFWKEQALLNHTLLSPDQLIVVSDLKEIYSETRCFVVGGKIVSGSTYKRGPKVKGELSEQNALEYAEKMIKIWQPESAFVIDVADTSEGYKIIECNCINGSGFYATDTSKIVQALGEHYESLI